MKSQLKADALSAQLRARTSVIWIQTIEEARVRSRVFDAAAAAGYLPHSWDAGAGITAMDGSPERDYPDDSAPETAEDALDAIAKRSQRKLSPESSDRNVWVMCDLPPWLKDPITARKLRNLALPTGLSGRPRNVAQAIIIITPSGDVPPELKDHVHVIDWPMPDREEIAAILDTVVSTLPKDLDALPDGSRDAAIDAAVGLSGEQAQACFATSLVQLKRIDPATIAEEKKQAIRASGLEQMDALPAGLDGVGGLDVVKDWIVSEALSFGPEARDYGIDPLKGALLVGVPGCGKTHLAKAIATALNAPLVKVDLGAMRGKYVGESEGNIRNAFDRVDSMGRCVLLADEIEKTLAGASGESGDGGVSADALGFLLNWMQEHSGEAFVVATANNIDRLPPELLRKGRFDEVWWVDLPNEVERAEVLAATLRSKGRDPQAIGIDLAAVAAATAQFSGAEVASLVRSAMRTAFADKNKAGKPREITTDDLLAAAKDVQPKGSDKKRPDFARPATSESIVAVAASGARELDLS